MILSTFAGASRELVEALLVNPFDVGETATAIEIAMSMSREERGERMRLMRRRSRRTTSTGGRAACSWIPLVCGNGRHWRRRSRSLSMAASVLAPGNRCSHFTLCVRTGVTVDVC